MITGIGIDAVYVKRMERWIADQKIMERYFHQDEIAYVSSRGNGGALSLAARFAAKEAFGKALGTGLSNIELKDIMVINKENGRPEIKLFKTAQKALEISGADRAHISLTHERDSAIAVVILEKL
ncbi:MAG: holo-ACP synthase [Treponema sp.]|jgi:holo-[acyl-carrier protein] synthase|nr:holo-ACP synthase [Treponema sp.]